MKTRMRHRVTRLALAGGTIAVLGLLSACASPEATMPDTLNPPNMPAPAVAAAPATLDVPLLRLPPQSLGRTLAERQRVTVTAPQRAPQILDVLLEADAQSVRLALLQMGQVAARLVWDGTSVQVTQSRWWPREVSAERILSDLQMALWPMAAIQAALPEPWNVVQEGQTRVLRHGTMPEMIMQTVAPHVTEVRYVRGGWQLQIESQSLQESASGEAAP
ncbi:DUF3261 domain-containing protein [Imbroritus primus]|uniref:DUF3261 domain-containing protein n=1 Tax=Imbroritus primus TaxID=3058603 RepID=A0ACD3SU08_9BURK|nr:DUF3261 domain-containing protein [Burkholderiaceae bacterium PBA]